MSAAETRFGTFDELVASHAPEIVAIARQLRALILQLHPNAIEVIRLGDHAASYGIGPKKMSEAYSYIIPKAGYVNLGFYHGAALSDPEGLMEGTGKKMRHVKVHSREKVARPALHQLIKRAIAERRQALNKQ